MIFSAIAKFFGFGEAMSEEVTQRDAENNTIAQRSNAEAAQVQADKEKARKDIKNPDQTDLMKDIAP